VNAVDFGVSDQKQRKKQSIKGVVNHETEIEKRREEEVVGIPFANLTFDLLKFHGFQVW